MTLDQLVLICGTLVFALLVISAAVILRQAIVAAGDKEPAIFGRLGGGGNAVRIVILFAIVVVTFFLAVSNHLEASTGALLSAVAGFALGGLDRPRDDPSRQAS